jgi:hypothetical protein
MKTSETTRRPYSRLGLTSPAVVIQSSGRTETPEQTPLNSASAVLHQASKIRDQQRDAVRATPEKKSVEASTLQIETEPKRCVCSLHCRQHTAQSIRMLTTITKSQADVGRGGNSANTLSVRFSEKREAKELRRGDSTIKRASTTTGLLPALTPKTRDGRLSAAEVSHWWMYPLHRRCCCHLIHAASHAVAMLA